jgi:hypothetical protein
MDALFSIVLYILYGFFGFLLLLFVLAMLFGKRIKKKWEFEAEFHDAGGREFGEFDIEMSRIEKKEPEFSFKAEFKLRHESLEAGQRVQVYLDDLLVMEGKVATAGRVLLRKDAIVNEATEATAGQVCRVVYGGLEQFSQPIRPD